MYLDNSYVNKYDAKTPSLNKPRFNMVNSKIFWEEPILFDEIETPEIPASLLPGSLGRFATALALTSETPESLSVMTILGVVSSIISRAYVVSPKDGWLESTNMYCIIGLPPANNKTLVLRSCIKPLSDWEKEQSEILEPQIRKEYSERKTQEKIIETLRNKAAKEENLIEQKRLIQEVSEKEGLLTEPPILPCLFITDATPEELATKVSEQRGYLSIFSDEGGITEVLSGLYTGGSANIDILLKGIDGGDVKVRRKDKNFDLNPFLTMVLTVQPTIIQNMGEKRAYVGNGFLERFLYLLPKSRLGYRTHNTPPIPKEVTEEYHEVIRNLLKAIAELNRSTEMSTETEAIGEFKEANEKTVLTLSPEALSDWKEFQQEIELQLRPGGAFYSLQGWAGKICGFALRIAAILHVVETENCSNGSGNSNSNNNDNSIYSSSSNHIKSNDSNDNCNHNDNKKTISARIMSNALEIVALLTQHAVAAYNLIGIDQNLQDAKELFNWIVEQNKRNKQNKQNNASFTQTEVTYAMRHRKLGKKERLASALQILIDRNILQSRVDSSTHKPTTHFLVNPLLLNRGQS